MCLFSQRGGQGSAFVRIIRLVFWSSLRNASSMLVSPSFNAFAVTFHIFFQCREEIFLSRFMTPDGEDFFGSKVCGKREFHEVVQRSFYKFGSHAPERWHCRGCIGRYKVDVAFYESHWWERSANRVITFWAACPKATCVLRFVNLVVGYFIILLRPELGLPVRVLFSSCLCKCELALA